MTSDRRTFLELTASFAGASALGLAETDLAGAESLDGATADTLTAADDTAPTGEYVFGPIEVRSWDGDRWFAVCGSTDTNVLVAEET